MQLTDSDSWYSMPSHLQRSYLWQHSSHQITSVSIVVHSLLPNVHTPFILQEDGKKIYLNEPGRQKLERQREEVTAVGEVCKDIFWPIPNFEKRFFESPGFSAEGDFDPQFLPLWYSSMGVKLWETLVLKLCSTARDTLLLNEKPSYGD